MIVVDVERIQDACGFGVPVMDYRKERDQLVRWAESKGDEGLIDYRIEKNTASIDGLPGW